MRLSDSRQIHPLTFEVHSGWYHIIRRIGYMARSQHQHRIKVYTTQVFCSMIMRGVDLNMTLAGPGGHRGTAHPQSAQHAHTSKANRSTTWSAVPRPRVRIVGQVLVVVDAPDGLLDSLAPLGFRVVGVSGRCRLRWSHRSGTEWVHPGGLPLGRVRGWGEWVFVSMACRAVVRSLRRSRSRSRLGPGDRHEATFGGPISG